MAKMKQRNDIYCVMTEKGLVCENTWIFTTGRIKRMRKKIILGKKTMLNKRLGKRTHQVCIMSLFHTITRWNRH